MELQSENAIVKQKSLTVAAFAFGQVDRAFGNIKSIPMPMKNRCLMR